MLKSLVVSLVMFVSFGGAALAAPSPVSVSSVEASTVAGLSADDIATGEKLWQKYIKGDTLSKAETRTLVQYVVSDQFLNGIQDRSKEEVLKFKQFIKDNKK